MKTRLIALACCLVVSLAGCEKPRLIEETELKTPRGNAPLAHQGARSVAHDQSGATAGGELPLTEFRPRSMLKVAEHPLERAKFPVVDAHTHFRLKLEMTKDGVAPDTKLENFVKVMDRNNIAVCVSLDGGLGEQLQEHKKFLWTKYPDRFVIFANIDFQGAGKADDSATWDCQREDFGRRTALALADAKKAGASGVKFFKSFGLAWKNPDGSLIRIDDPRWDEIWKACGELGLPVLIHTADPAAFFEPIDATNERWEELYRRPEWSFADRTKFPRREELFAQLNAVIERHPKTIFVAAHMANNPEDLATVAAWLDKYPNLYVEIASRIAELGRQPYTARKFFIGYQDRILFGTDGPWPEARLRLYWRFLETFDENFPYSEKVFPPQGFWNIYGIGLPDEVLRKVYHENAARIIPGVKEKLQAPAQP
jgi:predicted TIM-barrel fold metal-dependent hydrolase